MDSVQVQVEFLPMTVLGAVGGGLYWLSLLQLNARGVQGQGNNLHRVAQYAKGVDGL